MDLLSGVNAMKGAQPASFRFLPSRLNVKMLDITILFPFSPIILVNNLLGSQITSVE